MIDEDEENILGRFNRQSDQVISYPRKAINDLQTKLPFSHV